MTILMADDDPDDRFLVGEALTEASVRTDFRTVEDGEKLMDYLRRKGKYADPELSPRPSLILLDLNMPRKDGREALKEIKADPDLRQIPIVVLSTSQAPEDIFGSYDLGANSFASKPGSYDGLHDLIETITTYWAGAVLLPGEH